jgi:hypothetical protein
MDGKDAIARSKTEPIERHERAVIGRLVQACVEALRDERIDSRDGHLVLRQLTDTLDRSMLAIRRAHPWVVERITTELERFIEHLVKPRA